MRVGFLCVATCVATCTAIAAGPSIGMAQGGTARAISIDEAVHAAQQNAPSVVLARNSVRTSDVSIKQTTLGYLPSLALSATANQRGGTQLINGVPLGFSGSPWSYSRGLNSSLTLWDGGQRYYNLRAAESNRSANEANETLQRYQTALNVKTQYFAVLAAREQDAAAHRQLEQAQQQLVVASTKMMAGTATRSDSLSAAVAVGQAKLSILNAQNGLGNANAALTRLVGSATLVTAVIADTSDVGVINVSEDELTRIATDGPAIRQSQATLTAAGATHKAATAPYMPQVAMTGSYSWTPEGSKGFDFGDGVSSKSTALGFSVSYNVFNGYNREATLANAKISEENAMANLRDARLAAVQNLTTQLNSYRTAVQSIELNKLQISASEENLRVVQQQYNLGTKQALDVLTVQSQLDNARLSLITARLNARSAKAQIEALIGRDLK